MRGEKEALLADLTNGPRDTPAFPTLFCALVPLSGFSLSLKAEGESIIMWLEERIFSEDGRAETGG